MPARNSTGRFTSTPGAKSGGSGFHWVEDTLTPRMEAFPGKVQAAIAATMKYHEPQVESYMRTNARWTDRTSNARNGLSATYVFTPPGTHVIVCFHSVPYGIWLEIAHGGRYRIIIPTILNQGIEVMRTLQGVLKRIA